MKIKIKLFKKIYIKDLNLIKHFINMYIYKDRANRIILLI